MISHIANLQTSLSEKQAVITKIIYKSKYLI